MLKNHHDRNTFDHTAVAPASAFVLVVIPVCNSAYSLCI